MTLEGMQLGNYRLQRFIGSGAMGAVYQAEDIRIARQVAIKVVQNEMQLYPNAQATADAQRLFQREMKALTALDHPHILPLIDFGEQTINKTTYTYLVMPYRPEGSLVDWLQQRSSTALLSPQEVVEIVRQAADALQHAHTRQLLHLDVKPSNFLVRQHAGDPRRLDLLLADFGVAKFITATSTVSQTIRGTPPYMAPEQWAGTPTPATDQYALAIMAYHLLTGRFPFEGAMQQVMYKHLQERPQPPSTFNSAIPSSVDAVILTALEKKSEERFASVQAFANAFVQAWQRQGAPAPSPLSPPQPGAAPPRTPTNTPALLPTQQAAAPPRDSANASALPTTQYVPPPVTSALPMTPTGLPPTQAAIPGRLLIPKKLRLSRRAAIIGLIVLVIVGSLAFVLTRSPWHTQNSGTTTTFFGVGWSGSQFVAVGNNGGISTSPDGSTWTSRNSGTSQHLRGVAWGDSQFVVVGDSGTILTSPDGNTWKRQDSGTSEDLRGVAWGGSRFVVLGGNLILTSPDGSVWGTAWTAPPDNTSRHEPAGVVWSGSQFVVVGDSGTILTSSDGNTWTPQDSGTNDPLLGVGWSGSQFVAVGASSSIFISSDGRTWASQNSGTSFTLYAVAGLGDKLVAVGVEGTIVASSDGHTWMTQKSGTNGDLFSVIWAGSQFVAVGLGGTILTAS